MITKERLQELIEQGATIYAITKNPFIAGCSQTLEVEEFDLKAPIFKAISEDGKQFLYYDYLLDLEYLFETEEDARWEIEMIGTRIETLKMPTWEKIKNLKDKTIVSFYAKDMTHGIVDVHIFRRFFNVENEDQVYFYKELTKENYIEACKLCLRLFKGEEVC